jgi:GNAT superfamily N-acetyltransferase
MDLRPAKGGAAVRITAVSEKDDKLLQAVIRLGDRFTDTLGFLPQTVFEQAARAGTLIAATNGSQLAGYALYGLPADRVRLTHLCVEPEHRGTGVSRQLVDAISDRHQDRLGILLKCRKDYRLERMWSRLGFVPRTEVDGRGRARKPLVVWWRDHGHPDLFSELEPTALLTAAMDCNVFADIHASRARTGSQESQALAAEWLENLLDLVVLPQLMTEIHNITDPAERRIQLQAATTGYHPRQLDKHVDHGRTIRTLIESAWDTLGIELPRADNDLADLQYVVEASAAGVRHLITRDAGLLELSPVAEAVCGVRILRPADIVLQIDELTRAQVYQPGSLLGTTLATTAVPAGHEQEQLVFHNHLGGERQKAFKARLRYLAAQPDQWNRQQIIDGQGALLATYCHGERDEELQVPLLRVNEKHPLASTLARQILFMLRQRCRDGQLEILRLTDPHLQRTMLSATTEDAFQPHGNDLLAFVLNQIADTAALDRRAADLAGRVGLDLPRLQAPMPAAAASAIEHAWWPAKITDADLPTFLVPIRPKWAYDLFGFPTGLLPRSDLLGLSREHVYYRSPRSRGEKYPARILWYASSDRGQSLSCVIGCSRLDQVVVGDGEQLYQQFKHLGVYQLDDVLAICDTDNRAMALRFSDTGLFPRPVSRKRLLQLGARYGDKVNVQSVFKISSDLFHALYEEGHPAR